MEVLLPSHPKITSRGSLANDSDIPLIRQLLQTHPGLKEFNVLFHFHSGYSSSRVYLGLAQFGISARNPWIIKVGPEAEIHAEESGFTLAKAFVPPQNIINKVLRKTSIRSSGDN
jgi:hypothetical protein